MDALENAPIPESALGAAVRSLPSYARRLLGLPQTTAGFVDLLMHTVRLLMDDTDDRPTSERLAELAPRFNAYIESWGVTDDSVTRLQQRLETDLVPRVERIASGMSKQGSAAFLRRLLGAKTFDRFARALGDDGALLIVAARRCLRFFLPFAAALQDAAAVLPEGSGALVPAAAAPQPFVQALMHLDGLIDQLVDKQEFDLAGVPARADEVRRLQVDYDVVLSMLRHTLKVDIEHRMSDLSALLLRKLRGVDDALAGSSDGISQAANSIVEFIDRLFRLTFSDEEVLEWVRTHAADEPNLINSLRPNKPTKRAHALCFACAGEKWEGDGQIERMLANSIVKVRTEAEKLKHADSGSPHEEAQLRSLMNALRGFITATIRMNWTLRSDGLERLRNRLTTAA